jgi:hypothetical protein
MERPLLGRELRNTGLINLVNSSGRTMKYFLKMENVSETGIFWLMTGKMTGFLDKVVESAKSVQGANLFKR